MAFLCALTTYDQDRYGYHITTIDKISSIYRRGLLPQNGDRCKSVHDETIGVFFTPNLQDVKHWMDTIYENYDHSKLVLIRFKLFSRKYDARRGVTVYEPCDFYLFHKVKPEHMEFARIFDPESAEEKDMTFFDPECLEWSPLSEHPVLKVTEVRDGRTMSISPLNKR